MSEARLAAGIEASAFLRQAEISGGFGAVIHKGDAERGTLLIAVSSRGRPVACLARQLSSADTYRWQLVGPGDSHPSTVTEFLASRRRRDPDEWQIELDIPSAEQFIAETTSLG